MGALCLGSQGEQGKQPDICPRQGGSARRPANSSGLDSRGAAVSDSSMHAASDDIKHDQLTCWLINRMAMSFRSVKSSKADSITLVCVSNTGSAGSVRASHGLGRTAIHNEEVLLLLLVDMSDTS